MYCSKAALSLLLCLAASSSYSAKAFTSQAASFVRFAVQNPVSTRSSPPLRMVASVEPRLVADMQRGIGGRLEEAFGAAKERGEAAFVTFVTAGYPSAQGALMFIFLSILKLAD